MIGCIIATLAFMVIFGLPILMTWLLRNAPLSGSTRPAHYTGRRRDGGVGQIGGRGVRWD